MEYEEKIHPTVGILVRSNGEVFVPANGTCKAHWTFGCKNGEGYMIVQINGKQYHVHRLVAETFLPNPENKPFVDHISRDRADNRAFFNLRWATEADNQRNTRANDRCLSRLGVNYYSDGREANRRNCALWYQNNKEGYNAKRRTHEYREQERLKRKQRRAFGRYVSMSNGKNRFFEEGIAQKLLSMPRIQRTQEVLNELGC